MEGNGLMTMKPISTLLAACAAALLLSACGGDKADKSTADMAPPVTADPMVMGSVADSVSESKDRGTAVKRTATTISIMGTTTISFSMPLPPGTLPALWMTPDEVRARATRHRSPLVVQSMEDYLRGQRYPLELVQTDLRMQRP